MSLIENLKKFLYGSPGMDVIDTGDSPIIINKLKVCLVQEVKLVVDYYNKILIL